MNRRSLGDRFYSALESLPCILAELNALFFGGRWLLRAGARHPGTDGEPLPNLALGFPRISRIPQIAVRAAHFLGAPPGSAGDPG